MSFAAVKQALVGGASLVVLAQASGAVAQSVDTDAPAVAEVIVTAAKREQSQRDVSGSVTAVTQEALQGLNAQSLSDYITRVPGVVFNDYQPGVSEVVIRGVASTTYHEANQTTTGYYLNELPLTEPGFPLTIPDIDSFDLSRVEVLRGPQGTLFGSTSLGGAINYVVNEAKPGEFDAGVEAGVSSTRRSDGEYGYSIKGMVNVPLFGDKLAARIVALQRFDAGYLNNTLMGEKGSNDLEVRGLRASLVFEPTDATRISALSMYQEYNLADQTYVLFGPPETYDRATNLPEHQDTQFMMHSLRADHDLGFATLTAIGSYTEKEADLAFDYSIFGGNDPRTGTPLLANGFGKSKTDYAEVRLTSPDEGPLKWLVGVNYTRSRSQSTDALYLEGIGAYIDANPGSFGGQPSSLIAPGDLIERSVSGNEITEKAIFGEASYAFTDTVTLTVGGRLFEYETSPRIQYLPNAYLVPAFDYAPAASEDSDFIPKVSLTYKPSSDFMVYALYSEGFRIGGVNVFSLATPGLPLTFESDATTNLEIGTRFDLADNRIAVDFTVYRIEWNDMQARLFTPDNRAYTVNGGGAEISGAELTVTARPTRYLTLASNVSYNDAKLSALLPDSFAPGGGYAAGTRLPGASEWTLSNTADFSFPDMPLKPRIGLAHRYVSEAPVDFAGSLDKGDFHIFDLNASLALSDRAEVGFYVKNLLDEYGVLNAPFAFAGSVARPRTLGLTVRYSFN